MSSIVRGSPGIVYIMANSSMMHLLKIGSTTLDAVTRAKQLTAATASPTPFVVLYQREVSDCTKVEEMMHDAFADRRVNENREFFRVSLYEAAMTLDALSGAAYSAFDPPTPFAELFAGFEDRGDGVLNEEERAKCRILERKLAS